jgi:hypothetical protein
MLRVFSLLSLLTYPGGLWYSVDNYRTQFVAEQGVTIKSVPYVTAYARVGSYRPYDTTLDSRILWYSYGFQNTTWIKGGVLGIEEQKSNASYGDRVYVYFSHSINWH